MTGHGAGTRRFIVGTHSFLLVASFDENWSLIDLTVLDRGHFYGIAPTGDGGFLAKGGQGERITRYVPGDASYDVADTWFLGDRFRYVHQIALLGDELWIANTDHNAVDVQPLDRSRQGRRLHYRGATTDENHVNSVFPCGDTVFTLLNNKGRIPSQVVAVPARGELRELKALPLWDTGCHNVFLDRSRLLYNASQRGHLVAVDLHRQQVEHRVAFEGHTKGLSVTAEEVVVGVSDHATRRDRFHSRGYLAVLRRHDLDRVALIDLNDALGQHCGNVNEVRRIDRPDDAHVSTAPVHEAWPTLKLSGADLPYRARFLIRRTAMDTRNRVLHRRPTRLRSPN